MTNYYDNEAIWEGDNEKLKDEYEAMEVDIMQGRSRFSLKDALEFDQKYVNKLLNGEITEAVKYQIASIHGRVCAEHLDTNTTAKSFDDFLRERLGEKKYYQYTREWLNEQGNQFFMSAGMPEMMKPSTIYRMDN